MKKERKKERKAFGRFLSRRRGKKTQPGRLTRRHLGSAGAIRGRSVVSAHHNSFSLPALPSLDQTQDASLDHA